MPIQTQSNETSDICGGGELSFVQVFAMEPEERGGAVQVLGETSTELRSRTLSGLRLSCVATLQILSASGHSCKQNSGDSLGSMDGRILLLLLFWFFNTITNNLEFTKHCLHIRLNHLKLPFLRVKRPLNTGSFLEFNLIHDFISQSYLCEICPIIINFFFFNNRGAASGAGSLRPRTGALRWLNGGEGVVCLAPSPCLIWVVLPPSEKWETHCMIPSPHRKIVPVIELICLLGRLLLLLLLLLSSFSRF